MIYQNYMNNYNNSIEEVSEMEESRRNSVSPIKRKDNNKADFEKRERI